MTSDGEALFRAICAQPWDDTPRLAYADWLDENGRPERAEFIRVQIELARLPEDDRDDSALARRSRELEAELYRLAKSKKRPNRATPWKQDVPHMNLKNVGGAVDPERGFWDDVIFLGIKSFRAHAEAVFAGAPISRIKVEGMTTRAVADLVARPWLGQLRGLALEGPIRADGLATLLAAGPFPRLEGLWVDTGRIGDAGATLLARTRRLPNLRTLWLLDNNITIEGADALRRSKTLPKLEALNGLGNKVEREMTTGRTSERFAKRFPKSWWTC
jgi:uncharacterized protein (TIGR02996 family)